MDTLSCTKKDNLEQENNKDEKAVLIAKKLELVKVENELKRYKKAFGELSDPIEPGKALQQVQLEYEKLKLECERYQKTEATLMSEIETIGKAWATLEEQTARKVEELYEKEDKFGKLVAEKVKLEQKCASLTKQNTANGNTAIAFRKQSDKQLEQIRKLEELEKNLDGMVLAALTAAHLQATFQL